MGEDAAGRGAGTRRCTEHSSGCRLLRLCRATPPSTTRLPPLSADCNLLSELYNRGNEIADHTVTHTSLLGLDAAGLEREILGARAELAACGIPEEDVVGLRAPYLETKTEVRQLLHENGFLYER